MAILLNPYSRLDEWKHELPQLLPGEELRWWPDIGDPADVDLVVAWRLPRATLAQCTHLEAILSLGAGVEQWTRAGVPEVPIVRLDDPGMSDEMAAYVLAWVVRHHRGFGDYEIAQRSRTWQVSPVPAMGDVRVGILGYGTIGARIGRACSELGYAVNGWARRPREVAGISMFCGDERLVDFLASSDVVVNVLPSTEATSGLLERRHFDVMPAGSLFVNVGRGTVLADERDLIDALDHGPLGAAVLDVTDPEPPRSDSPLFDHPAVTLTPHVAGATRVATAASLIAANVTRIRRGETPFPLVDRRAGY